jgi:hypothetical protein
MNAVASLVSAGVRQSGSAVPPPRPSAPTAVAEPVSGSTTHMAAISPDAGRRRWKSAYSSTMGARRARCSGLHAVTTSTDDDAGTTTKSALPSCPAALVPNTSDSRMLAPIVARSAARKAAAGSDPVPTARLRAGTTSDSWTRPSGPTRSVRTVTRSPSGTAVAPDPLGTASANQASVAGTRRQSAPAATIAAGPAAHASSTSSAVSTTPMTSSSRCAVVDDAGSKPIVWILSMAAIASAIAAASAVSAGMPWAETRTPPSGAGSPGRPPGR